MSSLARPKISRFCRFKQLTCAATGPFLHRARERGAYGGVIVPHASSKALELANATVLGLCQPALQVRVSLVGQHADEGLGQLIRAVEMSMSCADVGDLLWLLLIELHRLTHIQKGGLSLGTGGV